MPRRVAGERPAFGSGAPRQALSHDGRVELPAARYRMPPTQKPGLERK